jgi:hypothetical protein
MGKIGLKFACLVKRVADLLTEVAACPGFEPIRVGHGPGVGVLGWGKFGPQPLGDTPVRGWALQYVL